MGDCIFPFYKIHGSFQDGAFLAGNGSIYGSGFGIHLSADNGKILAKDGRRALRAGRGSIRSFGCNHSGQYSRADHMLCNNGQSGCVLVQTVDTAEDKWFILFCKIPRQCIGKGIAVIIIT